MNTLLLTLLVLSFFLVAALLIVIYKLVNVRKEVVSHYSKEVDRLLSMD